MEENLTGSSACVHLKIGDIYSKKYDKIFQKYSANFTQIY